MCVYMLVCMHISVCACSCMCVGYMCTCVYQSRGQRSMSNIFLNCSFFFLKTWSSTKAGAHGLAGLLASKALRSACLHLPITGVIDAHCSHGVPETKLSFPCLFSKHFAHWDPSPNPSLQILLMNCLLVTVLNTSKIYLYRLAEGTQGVWQRER